MRKLVILAFALILGAINVSSQTSLKPVDYVHGQSVLIKEQSSSLTIIHGDAFLFPEKSLGNQYLLFVAESNFCPDSCSCATGKCGDGKAGCADKFCYNGFIIKTDSKGAFTIPLPPAAYRVYVGAIDDKTFLKSIEVGADGNRSFHLRPDWK